MITDPPYMQAGTKIAAISCDLSVEVADSFL